MRRVVVINSPSSRLALELTDAMYRAVRSKMEAKGLDPRLFDPNSPESAVRELAEMLQAPILQASQSLADLLVESELYEVK